MKGASCIILVTILLSTVFFTGDFVEGRENESIGIGSEEYRDGYRYNIQGWIYLHIEGDPYERGYQHGYLLADEIVDMIQRWNDIFPQKWSWKVHRLDAYRLFWNKYPEEYKQEIRGIADGVKDRSGKIDGRPIDYKDILAMNEMYEMMSRFRTYSVYPLRLSSRWFISPILGYLSSLKSTDFHGGKCSAFLATGSATVDGRIVASQSTFGGLWDIGWWHHYISERFNVVLDIQPSKGYRILMTTSPGLIWSDEDFYQNSAGMILMETTLPLGSWRRSGDPVVVRARRAIQYSDSIDEMVDSFLKKNNGLMANDWLMGDTKTGEIASLDLALYNYALTRTKDGFIYSCNNPEDNKVRWELYSFFGFGILGRIFIRNFIPSSRDIKFKEIRDEYYGRIDVDVAKKIMAMHPISAAATDCKITDSQLVNDFGFWCFMGKPDGKDFIASDHPFKDTKTGYTDLPACGWLQLYTLSSPNSYHTIDQKKMNTGGEKSRILWKYETEEDELGNAVYSSPTISDNILYATSWNGEIYAIDVNSGEEIWKKNVGWSSTSSPIIADDKVYVGSSEGLYALDKDSGRVLWEKLVGFVSSKPTAYDNIVYCGCNDGKIYAFESETGDLKWTYNTDADIRSSPAIHNNVLYVGSNDKNLYAIDAKNGKEKWSYETKGAIVSSPSVYDDIVYFGSWDNHLYAVNVETGKLKWKFTAGWGIDSSPTAYNDVVYVGSEDNNLYALDAKDGMLKWMFTANAGIQSSPTVYGGFVFFGSDDGKLYALNASNGDLVWSSAPDYHIDGIYNYVTKPIVSSPKAYDGKIYVGSTNGKIYCFDAKTFEPPVTVVEEVKVPVDTWLFVILPLLCLIMATMFYLYWDRKRTK